MTINYFQAIKKILPDEVKTILRYILCYLRLLKYYHADMWRYLRYSGSMNKNTEIMWEAKIRETYHVLEKGLSMPKKRPGFGEPVAIRLLEILDKYFSSGFSESKSVIQNSLSAIDEYLEFRMNDGSNISPVLLDKWEICKRNYTNKNSPIVKKTRLDVVSTSDLPFDKFVEGRHSIRNFSNDEIKENVIKKVVCISRNTPSACNRQPSKVYQISSKESISLILSLQNGNRGFGHLANKLLIVTSDLQVFHGHYERNQALIDGGMFSMSLLYALHNQKLGACSLNWCYKSINDKKLRNFVGIPKSEIIIMIIAVGGLPEEFYVAKSQKKEIGEILIECAL